MVRLFWIPLTVLSLLVIGVLFSLFFHSTHQDLGQTLVSRETLFALKMSLGTSMSATLVSLLLGVPAAYVLSRSSFRGKIILDTLLDLPLVITPLVAGVGLLFLFGQSLLGSALSRWGIHVLFTPLGAVVAQTFIAAPIVTLSSKAAFESVSRRYEWAAQTLGLRPWEVFFRITLPMAWHGILSGTVLAWTRALGEFGATLMVAGATRFRTETLPIAVYLNISSGELGLALCCACILLCSGFFLLLLLRLVGRPSPPEY
jgi:molybdate transport system permease protein